MKCGHNRYYLVEGLILDNTITAFIQLLEADCEAWEEAAKWAEQIRAVSDSEQRAWHSGQEEAAKFRQRIAEHRKTIEQLTK
jgi:hypothetical protein